MDDTDDTRGPAADDAAVESAVLQQLLALHPARVTFEELMREVAAEPEDFGERDSVERAVRDLAAAGLVHRNDDFVVPSRAALRFDELIGG